MNLNIKKENFSINKIIEQKHEEMVVEGDVIVPDVKPDILNTISTSATVCIYKKETMEGKIRIDGGVNIYIVYMPDNETEKVRSLYTVLDFTKMIDAPNCKDGMIIDDDIKIKSVECKILNGRKISIKATLDKNVKVYSNEQMEIINEMNEDIHLEKLESEVEINSLIGYAETKVYAKETIVFDNMDNLAEILKMDMSIINKDWKISYNKVLGKAEALVKIMYLTDDNRVNVVENKIPLMGFVDMPNVSDNHICDTKYKLKNMLVRANNIDEHSVYVEAEIELICYVYEKKSIKIIEDVYSPENILTYENVKIESRCYTQKINDICVVTEKVELERLSQNKVYDIQATPIITDTKMSNGKINYMGEMVVVYIYESEGVNKIESKEVKIPFEFALNINEQVEVQMLETYLEIKDNINVVMEGNFVETKINIAFETILYKNQKMNIINNIKVEENVKINSYSMTVYFVKDDDNLWKIAKEFNTTMDRIMRVNGMDTEKLVVGKRLFIPKYCKQNMM